jgi:ribosomal-protein-alanine N-acetyltransferase
MNPFDYFPDFDLGGVHLRQIRDTDATSYQQYMTSKEVTEFLTSDNIPATHEHALSDVRYWGGLFPTKRSFYWGIAVVGSDELVGTIGFNLWNRIYNRAEISYDLAPAFWGHGVMFHSMQKVLGFADSVLGVVRTQATVVVHNHRSIKLLERCGFEREGTLRNYEIVAGKYTDYYMYSRIKNIPPI